MQMVGQNGGKFERFENLSKSKKFFPEVHWVMYEDGLSHNKNKHIKTQISIPVN